MSDRIRQGLAYPIAMGMVIAVASAPTVAQTTDENAERVFEAAGVSVDKVDGLDATRYTTNRVKRAGKIVATNSAGVLPSNIVKPQWRVIQNKPDGFADGVDDAGVSGVRIVRVWGTNVTMPPGREMKATADCPSGFVVVGGGGYGSSKLVHLSASSASGAASWEAYATNSSTTTEHSIQAVAMCMRTQGVEITLTKKGATLARTRSR